MLRYFVATVCAFAMIAFGAPLSAQDVSRNKDLEQKLTKLTDDLTTAEINADMPALDRMFTDDFTKTAASVARVQTKSEFLDGLKSGRQKYVSFEFSNEKVRVYDGSAIVIANIHFKVINGTNPVADNQEVLSAIWVQQGGAWKCAAWITYRVPQPAPAD